MTYKSEWRIIGAILIVLIIALRLSSYSLPVNILSIMINKTLTQGDVDAHIRQNTVRWGTVLLTPFQGTAVPDAESFAMIPALIQGLAYYRDNDWETAVTWFQRSAEAAPYPQGQKSVIISPFTRINADSSFMLIGDSAGWQVRSDSDKGTNIQYKNDSVILSCAPDANSPKSAFVWSQPIAIPYHHTALIQAKIETGTTLIFETVSNGELTRHFIQPGMREIEQIEVTFPDDQLDLIYVLVRKNEDSVKEAICRTEIKSITFLLDEAAQ